MAYKKAKKRKKKKQKHKIFVWFCRVLANKWFKNNNKKNNLNKFLSLNTSWPNVSALSTYTSEQR